MKQRIAAIVASLILVAVLVATIGPGGDRAGASSGDPLTSFGTGGVLSIPTPNPCGPCPTANSTATTTELETAETFTILGYGWSTATGSEPDAETPPADGAALAVTDAGAAPWVRQLSGPTPATIVRVLAVGYQPSPARVVAVVATSNAGAEATDPAVPVSQEIRRYTTDGTLASTTSLAVSTHGVWQSADVAPDGSVSGVEQGSTGVQALPSDTIHRYDTAGALRWTVTLPAGDGIERVEVSNAGQVVLAGSTATPDDGGYDGLVAAITDAGTLDTSFGSGGRITVPAPPTKGRALLTLDVTGDQVAASGRDDWQIPEDSDADSDEGAGALVSVRISAGHLLGSFDGDGIATQPWEADSGARLEPAGVLLDGDRLVVAGASRQADGDQPQASLIRRSASGSADDTFNIDPTVAPAFDAIAPVVGGYVVATSSGPEGAWRVQLRALRADGGGSAGPVAPPPKIASAAGGSLRLTWTAVAGATGYDLLIDRDLDDDIDLTSPVAPGAAVDVAGLAPGRSYRFALRARGTAGVGPRSTWSPVVIPPFLTVDSFTDRQYRDFAGRGPTTAELSTWRTKLAGGMLTPVAAVQQATAFSHTDAVVPPVVRLYRAYLLRLPDTSGLAYWVGRSRSGLTLSRISASFATSGEFTRRYGSLSNRAFVEQVYRNVLGRAGDASGIGYWTNQLDLRRRTRGDVMVNFSESSEYRRTTSTLVHIVVLYAGLIERPPTEAEAAAALSDAASGGSTDSVVASLLGSAAYESRIP